MGLKEDFGFEHVFWVYSGRRGVHAWISDEDARMLSNDARSAVAHYFEVCFICSTAIWFSFLQYSMPCCSFYFVAFMYFLFREL